MTKKRKNRGRSKGDKGKGRMVQCTYCGKIVPQDKAKKIYKRSSFINGRLAYELRKQGAYIPGSQQVSYSCISCAVHRGRYSPRQEEKRRKPYKKKR